MKVSEFLSKLFELDDDDLIIDIVDPDFLDDLGDAKIVFAHPNGHRFNDCDIKYDEDGLCVINIDEK